MKEKSEVEAAMRICSSSRTAAEIASMLPVKASRLVERGSRLNGGTARDSRWILDSPLSEESTLEDHIVHLLDILESNSIQAKGLPGDCQVDIWCSITSSGEFAGFSLNSALLKRVAAKDIELVFSVYSGSV